MKEITVDQTKKIVFDYVSKLAKQHKQSQAPRVGVNLQLMSGQFLKTAEFTVDDIAEALDQGKRWLKQKNGGAINLGYVVSYSPYKFYPKDDARPGKQRYEY